ncbi:MAG TPA: (d)CMP kinase [Terriglobia bacterium]|nr:(d)CMP kinase [Terriglobia bacterium]
MRQPFAIAIDGPAGVGKSTVARGAARRLGAVYVDSGATYRAAALKVLESGASPDDAARAAEVVTGAAIRLEADGPRSRVLLDGRDVEDRIRTPEVTLAASKVSRLPEVRRKLIALQRRIAAGRDVVMEGRDIGTVVLPDARLKIFLTADPQARARRRLEQDRGEGRGLGTLDETAREIARRDRLDTERSISPLVPAADAVELDTTALTAEEAVERIVELARERGLHEKAQIKS